jgi:hypothetical protein
MGTSGFHENQPELVSFFIGAVTEITLKDIRNYGVKNLKTIGGHV